MPDSVTLHRFPLKVEYGMGDLRPCLYHNLLFLKNENYTSSYLTINVRVLVDLIDTGALLMRQYLGLLR